MATCCQEALDSTVLRDSQAQQSHRAPLHRPLLRGCTATAVVRSQPSLRATRCSRLWTQRANASRPYLTSGLNARTVRIGRTGAWHAHHRLSPYNVVRGQHATGLLPDERLFASGSIESPELPSAFAASAVVGAESSPQVLFVADVTSPRQEITVPGVRSLHIDVCEAMANPRVVGSLHPTSGSLDLDTIGQRPFQLIKSQQ